MGIADITWRERKALKAFTSRDVIYTYNMPTWIGHKTMASLVKKGIVEIVDPDAGLYSQRYGWRLCAKPDAAT
jgi:hypothetical protein